MTEFDRRPIVDQATLIPVTLILAPIAFSFWLGGRLNALDSRLQNIELAVETASVRGVALENFRIWRANFQAKNPDIEVPPLMP